MHRVLLSNVAVVYIASFALILAMRCGYLSRESASEVCTAALFMDALFLVPYVARNVARTRKWHQRLAEMGASEPESK